MTGNMNSGGESILYVIWLAFAAIYFCQGAATGALRRHRGRSAKAVWPIPNWGRLLCLLIGGGFAAATVVAFLRIFKTSK
jgi:hypothetical protein